MKILKANSKTFYGILNLLPKIDLVWKTILNHSGSVNPVNLFNMTAALISN